VRRLAATPAVGALTVVAAAVAAAGCGGVVEPAGPPRPGRIILLSMDTVRADRVSGYGPLDTTPVLAEIAAEGLLFQNSYGASTYTIPSHMSVFTGLDAAEHGVHSRVARLAPDVPTLAEMLAEAGYRTHAFHEGGYVAGRFGFERGFERYEERPRIAVAREALPEVLDWMRANADAPYFLFLHTYAAHFPYGGIERYRGENPDRVPSDAEIERMRAEVGDERLATIPRKLRGRYALINQFAERHEDLIGTGDSRLPFDFPESEDFERDRAAIRESYDRRIRLIDEAVGRIRATLVDLGQWDDTLLVVFSDHGEAFFEHGLQRHDYVPFDEVLRVPLVVSYPRLLRERDGHVWSGLAWHLDLLPTILGLAGVDPPPGLAGVDLTDVLAGRDAGSALLADRAIFPAVLRPAFREQRPLRRVVLAGGWKYIEGHENFGDEQGFLFDLGSDPAERQNLRTERPGAWEEMAARAGAWAAGLRPPGAVHQETGEPLSGDEGDVELSEEELEKLRGLGYVE